MFTAQLGPQAKMAKPRCIAFYANEESEKGEVGLDAVHSPHAVHTLSCSGSGHNRMNAHMFAKLKMGHANGCHCDTALNHAGSMAGGHSSEGQNSMETLRRTSAFIRATGVPVQRSTKKDRKKDWQLCTAWIARLHPSLWSTLPKRLIVTATVNWDLLNGSADCNQNVYCDLIS